MGIALCILDHLLEIYQGNDGIFANFCCPVSIATKCDSFILNLSLKLFADRVEGEHIS